jgi:hypothetical protein
MRFCAGRVGEVMSTTLPEGQERAPGAPDAPPLCAAAAPTAAAPRDRKLFALVALGILVLGALPPLAFWFWVGRVPTLSLREAQAVLARPDSKAALVDVRSPEQYAAGHVPGAVNWPLGEIRKAGEPAREPGDEEEEDAGRARRPKPQ